MTTNPPSSTVFSVFLLSVFHPCFIRGYHLLFRVIRTTNAASLRILHKFLNPYFVAFVSFCSKNPRPPCSSASISPHFFRVVRVFRGSLISWSRPWPRYALCGLFLCLPARADDFPTPHNAGNGAGQLPLSPEESAKGFKLPPGFKANVFAAEPDVQNPVGMTWDNRGRLWVAECYTYANRPTRYDLTLRDRVIILHDKDGDGRADQRKVFCDNVQQLMSVEVGLGGVWLIALPRLLFIPDKNGDDIPDGPPETILDGFEVQADNYHNCANGLRWGPDGWLYGRCGASSPGWIGPPGSTKDDRTPIYGGIWRYHPTRKIFEVLCHGFTNPWGLDWDEYGEAFITNTVTGHLFHLIPGAHHTRSSTLTPNRRIYDTIDSHADHFHFDNGRESSRLAPRDEPIRPAQPARDSAERPRPDLRDHAAHETLGGGHAHCGACIYLGDNWPAEYRGKLLTLNLHGRRINVDRLDREGSGYVGRHEPDIALAEDKWFRGIDLNYGPDGAVYIIDWSDTGECHEHDGVHRTSGRVFRIAYDQGKPIGTNDLTLLSDIELRQAAGIGDEWAARHARRYSYDQSPGASQIIVPTDTRPNRSAEQTSRSILRTFWSGMVGNLTFVPERALDTRDTVAGKMENVRAWAIRALTDKWPIDTVYGKPRSTDSDIHRDLLSQFVMMAKNDNSGLVRLVLASTLQRIPPADRPALAAALLSHAEDATDHNLPKLIWYGLAPLADSNPESLVPLAANGKFPLTREWIARAIAEDPVKNRAVLGDLLATTLDKDESVRADIVRGLTAGLAGRHKVAALPNWEKFQASFVSATPELEGQLRNLAVLFGDGRALGEVRRVALDGKAKVPQRQLALETLIEAKPDDLKDICQQLLRVRFLNTAAMKGLSLFDDPALGDQLAKNYSSFHPVERPAVIETLVTRPTFATALLDQIEAGKIPAADLTALQARQIRSFGNEKLSARLAQVWGELRDSPADKQKQIDDLKRLLSSPEPRTLNPDLSLGRAVFQTTCANCHRLFGSGGTIAPDLTGSGRHNLDYLLSNIIDPSSVVNKDFRMSILRMADGRILNGLVTSQDNDRLVLQTAKEKLTLLKADIEDQKLTTLSPMPDSILQPLTPDQIRNLISYLQSPTQVDLPASP
jgi:putative membrane-bound dehydrogenase-like protein